MAETTMMAGVFDSEGGILKAAEQAREKGLDLHDAYTPYAVHGMDEALGRKETRLMSWLCLGFAAFGLLNIFGFLIWAELLDWPLNIGGKSFSAIPALVPPCFEITVLSAGVLSVISFILIAGLFPGRKPDFADLGSLDDKFVLVVKPGQRDREAEDIMKSCGAARVARL